jgi:hypothetical protein
VQRLELGGREVGELVDAHAVARLAAVEGGVVRADEGQRGLEGGAPRRRGTLVHWEVRAPLLEAKLLGQRGGQDERSARDSRS